jgi:sterol desaturase/sphingolipid hydroxylase (fatty acid hydroxylase superfamily)
VIYAAVHTGDGGFWLALARTLYVVVMRPPGVQAFEEDPPYLILSLVVGGMGGALVFTRSAPLGARLLYPLSRLDRRRTLYRASLHETTSFVTVVGGVFLLTALIGGAYAGYSLRLDFVPLLLRALVATAALIPAFQWFRLRVAQAGPRRSPQAMVWFIFALIVAVTAVSLWCTVSPRLLRSPAVEFPVLALLLGVSQFLYRRKLDRYFRTEDLA